MKLPRHATWASAQRSDHSQEIHVRNWDGTGKNKIYGYLTEVVIIDTINNNGEESRIVLNEQEVDDLVIALRYQQKLAEDWRKTGEAPAQQEG
jgi:hypothetical protein